VSEFDPDPDDNRIPEAAAPAWRWQEVALACGALLALFVVIVVLRSHLGTFVRIEPPLAIVSSRDMQERRGRTLSTLLGRRYVTEVDSVGESPRVYLGPAFEGLSEPQRLACMDSLYEAFYPGVTAEYAMLLVYDGKNRRLIGSYSPPHGLTLEQ
jgi:hypothetical protein